MFPPMQDHPSILHRARIPSALLILLTVCVARSAAQVLITEPWIGPDNNLGPAPVPAWSPDGRVYFADPSGRTVGNSVHVW
jgi:hypothetical protein